VGQLGVSGGIAVLGSDLSQVQRGAHDSVHLLSPGAWRGPPEPARVCRDTDHGAAGHEVAHRVSPPRVVVVLVHEVLPGDELEDEDARADERCDDSPAAHEEVAGVVADHVVQRQPEPPCSEAPGHRDTFEEHQEEQTHSTRGVLVKQLEHVDTAL